MAEEKKEVVLKEKNTPALLGFIFSLTVCLYLPGLILSIVGLATAKNYKNDRKGFAIAGVIISGILLLISFVGVFAGNTTTGVTNNSSYNNNSTPNVKKKKVEVIDFSSMTKADIDEWCEKNKINCSYITDYSDTVAKDGFISQSIESGKKIYEDDNITITYSLGHKKTAAEAEAEFKAGCEALDYREVLRTPSSFAKRKVHWFGKVSQVVSSGKIKKYMIYVNCSENSYASGGYICDDPIYIVYYGDTNLIEDDIVEVWGIMADDAYTYTTVLGASKTVPQVEALYVSIR